jgi:hypothetical protein
MARSLTNAERRQQFLTTTTTTTAAVKCLVISLLLLFQKFADGLALENNKAGIQLQNTMTVKKFRKALGLPNIYRCAKMDHLSASTAASTVKDDGTSLSEAERVLLHEAGLVIDLRSDSERDEEKAQAWMSQAPGGSFRIVRDTVSDLVNDSQQQEQQQQQQQQQPAKRRTVLRLDPLQASQFMSYLDEHWLSPDQKAKASFYKIVDGERLHSLRMQVLNESKLVLYYTSKIACGTTELPK